MEHIEQPTTEQEAPSIGPVQAVLGVFVSPQKTFEGLAHRPRFVLPFVLLVVAQLLFGFAIFKSGIVHRDAVAKMEERGAPPERIEAMERFFESPVAPIFAAVGGGLTIAFILLLNAGILYFMANLMMGARLTYRHYLSAATHGAAVGLVDQLVRLGIGLGKGTLDIRLGLGNFLADEPGFVGRALDTLTDPFLLWSTAVIALGVSVFARKGFGFGLIAVLPGFLLSVVLSGMR